MNHCILFLILPEKGETIRHKRLAKPFPPPGRSQYQKSMQQLKKEKTDLTLESVRVSASYGRYPIITKTAAGNTSGGLNPEAVRFV